MKKLILIIITIMIVFLTCVSCSDKYENVVIDIHALADDILNNITFDDQLVQVSESNLKFTYNFGECVDMVVYAGSGARAEEIIIIECYESTAADNVYTNVDTYYKNQKYYFKDYNPDETYKLDEPIFARIGKYVIYCVSPDTTAVQKILDNHIS